MNAPLLLADEPTGNRDTVSGEAVFTLLRGESDRHGTSVLFVTHNPELSARCDRTIDVVDGRVAHAAFDPGAPVGGEVVDFFPHPAARRLRIP